MDARERDRRRKRNREREDNSQPLIPTNILDQASQRIFVLSLFILIQSWKVYDLVLLKSEIPSTGEMLTLLNNFTFVLKYAILDGLFLWFLPVLNIQYLNFSPFKTLMLTVVLNGFSIFLVSSFSLPLLANVFLPVWRFLLQKKELNIIGESIDVNKVIDMDSHFKGQLTIQYLPDSSAKMNPFHFDQVCLGLQNNYALEMPIEFNTTSGIGYLQMQHTTPDNEVQYLNYTGGALRRLFRKDYSHLSKYLDREKRLDPRVFYVEYPINKPGMYRIKSVLDNKGNSIRTYKSEFVIADCPLAKFFYPPNFESSSGFKCLSNIEDDTYPLPWIEMYGTTPAFVKLNLKIDGTEYKMMNLSINLDSSRFISRTNFSWLKAVKLVRNLLHEEILKSIDVLHKGTNSVLEFQLLQIQDSLGNVHRYEPLSRDKDVWYKLKLRKSPSIGLYDKDQRQELLVGGTKTLSFSHLEEFVEDDFPLSVVVDYVSANNERSNITTTFKSKAALQNGLAIDKPGRYQLITATDNYCPCEIDSKPIDVKLAPNPSLSIAADPVSDRCLGTVGYNFDFNFTGKSPFKVQYRIYSNVSGTLKPVYSDTGKAVRELVSHEKSHSFKFMPPSEGSYTIVFNNLKDVNYYKELLPLDEKTHTFLTYFKHASQIGFQQQGRTIRTCYGLTAKIPLFFKGSGPFSFDYDFVDADTKKKLLDTVHVDKVDSYSINTPDQLMGKTYEVKLSNAKDKFGCDAIIADAHAPMKVISRLDVPEVQLDEAEKNVTIVEGSQVDIPLKFKSSIPVSGHDKVEIKFLAVNSKEAVIKRFLLVGTSIRLLEAGQYWLHSYESNGCKGRVINEANWVNINYYPKPSMEIISSKEMLQHTDDSSIHLRPVCYGGTSEITLKLVGQAPFVVDYEIKLPSGKVESHSMNIETHEILIKLPTKASGRFEHQFNKVYDSLYTKQKGKVGGANVPKIIYDVNPMPTAQFLPDNHFTQICENKLFENSIVAEVAVELSGAYPFDISIVLKNEQSGKTRDLQFRNVMTNSLILNNLDFLGLGDYSLSFAKIVDGNGCETTKFKSNDKYLISITEPPNIFKFDPEKKHYCVGDHVSYNLTGVFPVTIYYEYNDKVRKAQLYNNFERLASRPGVLNIHGLQDSGANACRVNYTFDSAKQEELRLQVHEIPTVEVNKGDYIIEDLHEGDQTELIFTFLGEPPFKLTYIRTIDIKKSGKKPVRKLVEKETISNIWNHELVVMASLEGTYEAIEIEDKYCRAIRKVDYID
ncbi:hypothetical protein Cantr_03631 [Candida viswanathii]|uniref:Nucleoporin POM152 n=1 Tax=Candida viswanathii TaxID=5486 RepID=A0A367XMC1_9ASCO|nr:hypothetical protein Cantr_03631 [Candida viswanathii]